MNLTRRSFWTALAAPIAAAAALVRKTPAPAAPTLEPPELEPLEMQWLTRARVVDLIGFEPELGHTFRLRTPAKLERVEDLGRRPLFDCTTHTIIARSRTEKNGSLWNPVSETIETQRRITITGYAIAPPLPASIAFCQRCNHARAANRISPAGLCRDCQYKAGRLGLRIDYSWIEECQNVDALPAGWEKSLEQALGYDPIRRNA